jgi:hypothetical protein
MREVTEFHSRAGLAQALLVLLLLVGCATSPAAYRFKETDVGPFTVTLPSHLRPRPLGGIDSLVGGYEALGIQVHFDYGAFSNRLNNEDEKGFVRSSAVIDGRNCVLASWETAGSLPNVTAIHFPGTTDGGRNGLTLVVEYTRPEFAKMAEQICRSIRFKK